MDKEKLAYNLFVRGFNYAIHYILSTQERMGIISYPYMEEIEKQFKDNYLDVLLREVDEKEKQKKKDDMNKIEKQRGWCYIHDEEMDCYNEDGDHDDYHCQKCEIRMVKCVICGKLFELIQSHFWDVFYLCEKCEDKLEDSTKCPNCKLLFFQLKKTEFRNIPEFNNHMDNCRPIIIKKRLE